MSTLKNEITSAQRAIAKLTEVAPILSSELEQQAREMLLEFVSVTSTFTEKARASVKGSFWDLIPRWITTFSGHTDLLRTQWRSRKLGVPPAKKPGEADGDYLRRMLMLSLSENGKKETTALLKAAEVERAASSGQIDTAIVAHPEINFFLKQIGFLKREEAKELIRSQRIKFLRDLASHRRIPFSGEVDATFIRKLHESATRFARNTVI